MSLCVFCEDTIPTRKKLCCSECKNASHTTCVHKSIDVANLVSEISGLSWKCGSCVSKCITVDQTQLKKLIDKQVQSSLATLATAFETLKSDLISVITERIVNNKVISPPLSYSTIARNNTHPAVIVVPKDQSQSVEKTKEDMANQVNPSELKLRLTKVKPANNGSIVIGCKNEEENRKFKQIAEKKLSDSYEIRELHGINPRVRVVGFRENYAEEDFLNILKQLNVDIFDSNSLCNVIKICKTKKGDKIFQAVLQLDRATYDKIIKVGNVFIGYDACTVFDGVEVSRCFNCNEFNHSSKSCTKPPCCPRCSQNHLVKDCTSQTLKCSNCTNYNSFNRSNTVKMDHAAWDITVCTVYKNACAKLRANLLGQ